MNVKLFRILIMTFSASFIIIATKKKVNVDWVKRIDRLLEVPHVKAFLDTIAYAEGTFEKEEYNALYCGHTFKDFTDHPRCIISPIAYSSLKKKNNLLRSSAAGRYQFLERIWDSISNKMQLTDFSPINQDRVALGLIREMGALKDLEEQKFEVVVKKISILWSSMPHSKNDQRKVAMEELKKFYKKQIAFYNKK